MSGHTPGPWVVKFQPMKWKYGSLISEQWVIKGPNNKHSPVALVKVAGYGPGPSKAVRKANATLIAAAPDMLEALEGMVEMATHHMMEPEERRDILSNARAAIAKAKGQA